MNKIHELMKREAEVLQKHRRGDFSNVNDLKVAVVGLLDDIDLRRGDIATTGEWQWACDAIIHWDSFLRSHFGICKAIRLPALVGTRESKGLESLVREEQHREKATEDLVTLMKETLETKIEDATDAAKSEVLGAIRQSQERASKEHRVQLGAYAALARLAGDYPSQRSSNIYIP